MKKLLMWSVSALVLMIGLPFLTVTFAGDSGMAICFLLFFVINPLYIAACGIFSGTRIKKLWPLPIISAVLFLVGVWCFFEIGEIAFLLYFACYLAIGIFAMLISHFISSAKNNNK